MLRVETTGMSLEDLGRVARELQVFIVPDSVRSSINRALIATRTAASKDIRADYNVAAAEIRATFSLNRASRDRLEGLALSSGFRIPLSRFGARQTRRGVTVNVRKSTGRQRLKRGFFGRGILPSTRLFRRTGGPKVQPQKGSYAGKMKRDGSPLLREPVEQLWGPSVPQMLQRVGVLDRVMARAEDVYVRTLEHELRRRIEKRIAEVNRRG